MHGEAGQNDALTPQTAVEELQIQAGSRKGLCHRLLKKRKEKNTSPGRALQSSGMEVNAEIKNAGTQMLLHVVQSAPASPSGSAVSALQSKYKEISQRRSKGKETHGGPLDGPLEPLQKKSDKEQSCLSVPEVTMFKSSAADELSEVQNLPTSSHLKDIKWKQEGDSFDCALGEKSRMENFTKSGDGGTLLPKPTSSPRYWTPPKGFWRAARRDTLVSNTEVDSLPKTTKNVVHAGEEAQKLTIGHTLVRKDLQGLESLESTFQRCFQKQEIPPDEPGRKDISDILSCQGRYKTEAQTTKSSSAMFAGGQYQPSPIHKGGRKLEHMKKTHVDMEGLCGEAVELCRSIPPSCKEADWDTAINFRSEFNLSPRHEQAKRLLERARLKARSQIQNTDHGAEATQKQVLELLPMGNPPPQIITTTHDHEVLLPIQLQDVRGKNSEHGGHLQRRGRLLSHAHFEEKSKKETVHCYLGRVCTRGLVLMDRSTITSINQSNQQPKAQLPLTASQGSKGLGSSQCSVGLPLAILTNQGDPSLETVLCKEEPRKCEACGSILKESRQNAEVQRNSGNQWVTSSQSSHQIIQPDLLEASMLTESSSLDENTEAAGASDAGDRVSSFGKLRRRSRKGENRVEASHGPYARGQDLLAQRRNSRTRSSMEEVTGPRSKPARGVTFAIDYFTPTATTTRNYRDSAGMQLPIKSALKSGSKSRPIEQHGVKSLPSAQEVERSPHHAVVTTQDFGAPSQVLQVSSGLTPCIKPSSLRYSSPAVTPVEPVEANSPSEDPTCAASRSPECRPVVRGAVMSKTEDLRAELLRSEHRKAELQWDENVAASRRTWEREGRPKLSLRRFFSAMGLNSMGKMVKGCRSSSMEQLSFSSARASPSPTHKGQTLLQRTPSLQSLHTESPLAQLRKASSVQSLQSPKKKYERSTILGELHLPLTLGPRDLHVKKGMENVDASQLSGPMGRIIQTFPDGSLLLELIRPVNAPFGFVISRGKGRPDSGIYVEQVGGSATENIYTSLLGVGDEILEVNGEEVTGLSLDQVTCLMTRESTATVRIFPHRWMQH